MIEEYRKVYVDVKALHKADGTVRPISLTFEDGQIYEIDRLITCCRAASTKVGGNGIRYTVRICNKETFLFEDDGRWFVEAKKRYCI